MRFRNLFLLLCALTLVQACVFGGRKDESREPVKLPVLQDPMQVRQLWSARVGREAEQLRLGLRPASDGTRVFAASHDGNLSGFDLVTGARDWRVETSLPLSAGPGYGQGLVVVASGEGDVIAVEAVDGVERWRTNVRGEMLAQPVIASGTVVVRTVNGKLIALDADSGKQRWAYEQTVPRLSLRGNASPAIAADRVVAGFDNGRLVAIRLADGVELWQAPLASQRGKTELERLADLDSDIVILGEEVYAAGFQSRAALVTLMDGQGVWTQDVSSAGGIAVDWTGVYVTAGNGVVQALDRARGTPVWLSEALLRRGVSGPEAFGEAIVVGDYEGYLHWLSTKDGRLTARTRAGKAAIVTPPLAVGERLLVQDEAGTLYAFALPAAT